MEKWNSRTEILIGKENIEKLEKSKVIIYGVGGVGSFVIEGLVRAGIGKITLVDNDVVSVSNINRQIHANIDNVGQEKVLVMKERILKINPNCEVVTYKADETEENYIDNSYSYVVDAIDTIPHKIALIKKADSLKVPIISAMGAGNKLDPTKFCIDDIFSTSNCKLSKIIRKELRKEGIDKLKVVYSKEDVIKNSENTDNTIGSISFVPSVAGMIIASEVIKDIIKKES